jgi:hypothetical protein
MKILRSVDVFTSRSTDPRLAWVAVASAIGLNSTAGLSEAQIGRQLGVSELSVRRATAKFTRLANLDPPAGFVHSANLDPMANPPTTETADTHC